MNNELPDMKDIWKAENQQLEAQLKINENLLKTMAFDKAATQYEKLLTLSICGRYLALVYCSISVLYAYRLSDMPIYSIPAIVGALAMLGSFFSHRPLKRVDFARLSVIELQRSINGFRIHTEKMKIWDISVVVLWLLTLTPAWLQSSLHVALYENAKMLIIFAAFVAVVIVLIFFLGRKMYADYHNKLQDAEHSLATLVDFEKE